jgi:hypothetical protein
MIRIAIAMTLLLALGPLSYGQESVRTKRFSFDKPALVVQAEFTCENGNRWLEANGTGTITLTISNKGKATAPATVATITAGSTLAGIQFEKEQYLGDVKPGETITKKVQVVARDDIGSQKGIISIDLKDGLGSTTSNATVQIETRPLPVPHLRANVVAPDTSVAKGENVRVRIAVLNVGNGQAREVSATVLPLEPASDVVVISTAIGLSLGSIEPGARKDIEFVFGTGREHAGDRVAFLLKLGEKRPQFSMNDTVFVALKAPLPTPEELAFIAYRRGDYTEAIQQFENVVATGSASPEVFFGLGMSYYKTDNSPRTLENIREAAGLGSTEAKRWLKENTISKEIITVSYTIVSSGSFAGYTPPIGLGILNFEGVGNKDAAFSNKFYEELKLKNESFRIYPYSTLEEEQSLLGVASLDPSNRQVLSALEKELSVNFVVTGSVNDESGSSLRIHLIRCADGATVFDREFYTSTTSTALNDAIFFLLNGRVPAYVRKPTTTIKDH